VAFDTKPFLRCNQKRFFIGTVGIVTGVTPVVFDNGVKLADPGWIIVALDAKGRTLPEKKRLVLRGVGIMAVHAPPVGSSFVHDFFRSRVVVTAGTQISDRL
jgi:hypothetical protein